MPVIGRKKSILLSKIVCVVIFIFLVASIFLIPTYISLFKANTNLIEDSVLVAYIVLYASLLPAIVADYFLFRLLCSIEKEEIFVSHNVRCLRILSWCCFLIGIIYTATGYFFNTAFVIAFAAFFIFLILRVIKNVFDAAVAMKEEYDYTI
ncbi:MAG TPA: hypothetical protein DIW17_09120 [Clostridiales bacterium]|nr:DUF2975 domain-containing protein [Eubacteriales bacterium]HBR30508.1 hypothetical protein [Clostridiales bacterium]HCS74022.1 hypothetical protein [Clostridiales bacterium]